MRTASINLRAQPEQRNLIDYAATLLGKSRSDFILETACQQAQNIILDHTVFQLNEADFAKFVSALEQPIQPNSGLEKLMAVETVWK